MKVFYVHGKRYSEAEVTLLPDRMERATYPAAAVKRWGLRFALHSASPRKRMGSGDPPGLQNRRAAPLVSPVRSTRTRFRQFSATYGALPAESPAIERQPGDFTAGYGHFVRDHIPVNVHCGPDVSMPH